VFLLVKIISFMHNVHPLVVASLHVWVFQYETVVLFPGEPRLGIPWWPDLKCFSMSFLYFYISRKTSVA